MIKSQTSINIRKPLEAVYDFLMSETNYPLWQGGIVKVTATNGLHKGSQLCVTSNNLGKEFDAEAEVIENDGKQKFTVVSTSGPLSFIVRYQLKDKGDHTEVAIENEVQTGVFFKLAEPVLQYLGDNKLQSDLKNLKIVLESAKP